MSLRQVLILVENQILSTLTGKYEFNDLMFIFQWAYAFWRKPVTWEKEICYREITVVVTSFFFHLETSFFGMQALKSGSKGAYEGNPLHNSARVEI